MGFGSSRLSDTRRSNVTTKENKTIRNNKRLKEPQYLHRSCKPIDEVDFEDNQLEMFEGFDCEGYCGL